METTSVEKSKQENIDLLQIEYFSDLVVSKKDIVVVESSNPIVIRIRQVLTNLGFENIYICKELEEGIRIFSDFIGNEISVPIIIDDNVSKQNLKNSVKEILEIQPSAKIIIITTKEKTDSQITELFDIGISSITRKPIDSEELEKSLSGVLEKKEVERKITIEEEFDKNISRHKLISENKIRKEFNEHQSEIDSLIQKKITEQVMVLDKEVLEATCNQCNSPEIVHNSKCPSCKQINIKQENLIEHYSCGEVYPKEPGSDICPKCNKHIGLVGKDYLESTDYYVCKSCNDKFPRPFFELICLNCSNVFIEGAIQWKKDKIYRIKN